MDQVFQLCPGLADLIDHSLCDEELIFQDDSEVVYKDLSFLAHNRITHLMGEEGEELIPCDIMVIDTLDGHNCCDLARLTYF